MQTVTYLHGDFMSRKSLAQSSILLFAVGASGKGSHLPTPSKLSSCQCRSSWGGGITFTGRLMHAKSTPGKGLAGGFGEGKNGLL